MLEGAAVDPDHQQGVILMSPEQFAAALVESNPGWSGDVPSPAPDGTVNFELSGGGRTADVRIEPAAPTSGAEIVSFTIEYS
jgi:hypothetical protein